MQLSVPGQKPWWRLLPSCWTRRGWQELDIAKGEEAQVQPSKDHTKQPYFHEPGPTLPNTETSQSSTIHWSSSIPNSEGYFNSNCNIPANPQGLIMDIINCTKYNFKPIPNLKNFNIILKLELELSTETLYIKRLSLLTMSPHKIKNYILLKYNGTKQTFLFQVMRWKPTGKSLNPIAPRPTCRTRVVPMT